MIDQQYIVIANLVATVGLALYTIFNSRRLERLKANYSIEVMKASKNHEQFMKVLGEIYSLISQAEYRFKQLDYIQFGPFEVGDADYEVEVVKEMKEAILSLNDYFISKKIYIPSKIEEGIAELVDHLNKISTNYKKALDDHYGKDWVIDGHKEQITILEPLIKFNFISINQELKRLAQA